MLIFYSNNIIIIECANTSVLAYSLKKEKLKLEVTKTLTNN